MKKVQRLMVAMLVCSSVSYASGGQNQNHTRHTRTRSVAGGSPLVALQGKGDDGASSSAQEGGDAGLDELLRMRHLSVGAPGGPVRPGAAKGVRQKNWALLSAAAESSTTGGGAGFSGAGSEQKGSKDSNAPEN